jgi:hypothetical protein
MRDIEMRIKSHAIFAYNSLVRTKTKSAYARDALAQCIKVAINLKSRMNYQRKIGFAKDVVISNQNQKSAM